jgi:hypothetical protein
MEIKRVVKRLFAVGAGVGMLGATAMGALAADLSNYPDMFVEDGVFNGLLVVGASAAAVDNLALTDIASSMKVASGIGGAGSVISGDAWLVGTSSKKFELSNNNATDSSITGETLRDINTFIGEEELGALADGEWATNENNYGFEQFIFFDSEPAGFDSRLVKYSENADDVTADHFLIKNARQIGRYKLEFTSVAQSDVTDTSGTADTTGLQLDDFEDTQLSMLGKSYTVVSARRTSETDSTDGGGAKLTLMKGATSDVLLEGETQTYTIGDSTYDVEVSFVDATNCKFIVNGEATNKLQDGETFVLSDGSEVGVSEVLYQSYAGGIHSCTFYLGAQKLELRDDSITKGTSTHSLRIGSEDIDGADVIITGTDNNSTFTITTIEVNMTAEDDFYVGVGEKLSDVIAAADEESEVLVGNAFDIEYTGLTEEETHDIRLRTSSSRRYKFVGYDGSGDKVEIPVAYAEAQFNLSMGEESWAPGTNSRANQKRLIIVEGTDIYKDDYFILTSGSAASGAAKSYVLQYKGSDRTSKTSPKIKFKNLGSGETLEYSVATNTSAAGTVATIKVGGYSFLVAYASPNTADDFQIDVDLDGGGAVGTTQVAFVDNFGSQWAFAFNVSGPTPTGPLNTTHQDYITLTQSTPNSDDYDNHAPTNVVVNITGTTSDPEVRATISGLTLVTPDGETEVSYGWTSMGASVTFNEPSSDPDEFTMSYPKNQRLPQLYFTSGATSTARVAGGNMVPVTIVDATRLDSEVASVSAQNLITVGGPCVNTVSADLLGNPADCTEGFRPGVARIKLFEHANGNMAMLVAGFSGSDTRLGGKVVAQRASDLFGDEVEVEGSTVGSARVGAPAVAASVVNEE